MSDGYIGLFYTPELGAPIAKTATGAGGTLDISEGAIFQGEKTLSVALLEIDDITVETGAITTIIVEHSIDNIAWEAVGSYTVEWTGVLSDPYVIAIPGMSFEHGTGIRHYFRVSFANSDGEPAVDSSDVVILLTDDSYFNGIDDFAEYPEVTGLVAKNASDENGDDYDSPAILPLNGIIRLQWDNMLLSDELTDHPFADGSTGTVTKEQLKNITSYVVYMIIAERDGLPFYRPWVNTNLVSIVVTEDTKVNVDSTSGFPEPGTVETNDVISVGSTRIIIADPSSLNQYGGILGINDAGTIHWINYTGFELDGEWYVTGIPASGPGSLDIELAKNDYLYTGVSTVNDGDDTEVFIYAEKAAAYFNMCTGVTAHDAGTKITADQMGVWYKIGETKNSYIEIDCPKDKILGFWVGCKIGTPTATTISNISSLTYEAY